MPEDANPSAIRAAAHEDTNLVTLLCESTASGLELLQEMEVMSYSLIEGSIIGDAGDMLQTSQIDTSNQQHVVIPTTSREKVFTPFHSPQSQADLTPIDTCIEKTGGEK